MLAGPDATLCRTNLSVSIVIVPTSGMPVSIFRLTGKLTSSIPSPAITPASRPVVYSGSWVMSGMLMSAFACGSGADVDAQPTVIVVARAAAAARVFVRFFKTP